MSHNIDDLTIQKIIDEYDNFVPNKVLARKYLTSISTVNRIIAGTYKPGFRSANFPRKKGWQVRALYDMVEKGDK